MTLSVLQKKPKKHYKTGEKQQKKNLDQFLTLDLDQFFDFKTPKSWDQFFDFTAYIIYTDIDIDMCAQCPLTCSDWPFIVPQIAVLIKNANFIALFTLNPL